MSIPLVVNGTTYDYPEVDDKNWGAEATDWASAVTSGMLQKAGGLFQLLADVDFGTSFGIKSLYYKSRTSSPADAGQIRLARADVINWRNQANDANLSLGVSTSNVLQFNGSDIQGAITVSDTSTIDLTFAADILSAAIISGSIDNSLISSSAAIAFSKLAALSSGNILVGNVSNVAASVAMSGDITITNAGVTAIGANKVTNSMLAQMAQSTFKGRAAGAGTGNATDLTATQATAILNLFTDSLQGLTPASGGGTSNYLRADGTWTTPAGAGDVVGPGSATDNGFARFDGTTGKLLKSSAATIANADVVAAAAIAVNKLAAITASRAVVSDGSGFISAATTTATEIGFVNGVTAAIQTQINSKLPTTITTTGDIIYSSSGSTGSRLAIGSAGQVLGVASGIPSWVTTPAAFSYRSVTTTDTPSVVTDTTLVCSSASFSLTLPTPTAGKEYYIIHNGTALSQVYTLNTTAGATIGGLASGVIKLWTPGEVFHVVFDGTNYLIKSHTANTAYVTYAATLSGFGTATSTYFAWARKGKILDVFSYWTNGTVAASLASISFPGTITLDLTAIARNNTTSASGQLVGTWGSNRASFEGNLVTAPATSTSLIYFTEEYANATIIPANGTALSSTGDAMASRFQVPIAEWQP